MLSMGKNSANGQIIVDSKGSRFVYRILPIQTFQMLFIQISPILKKIVIQTGRAPDPLIYCKCKMHFSLAFPLLKSK